jgi:hypothetical protein
MVCNRQLKQNLFRATADSCYLFFELSAEGSTPEIKKLHFSTHLVDNPPTDQRLAKAVTAECQIDHHPRCLMVLH